MVSINPFIIGQPLNPEKFIGHQEALALTLSRLGHELRASTSIIGAGYTGRSSFLRYLVSDIAREHHIELQPYWSILWEATSDDELTPQLFWTDVFSHTRRICEDENIQQLLDTIIGKAENRSLTMPELRMVVDQIGQTGHTLLLAIDDFDRLLYHPNFIPPNNMQFFERLRHLCQRASHGLAIVTATTRPLKDMWKFPHGSIFYNIFANACLGPLSDDEIDELLNRMLQDTEVEFDDDDVNIIREYSANLPVFIQYYAGLLFDAHAKGFNTEQRKAAIQSALSQPDNMHTYLTRYLMDRMNPSERNAFTKLVNGVNPLTTEEKSILQTLQTRGGFPPGVEIP